MRIAGLDPFNFPFASPALDAFLTGNSVSNLREVLLPDKSVDVVPAGKPRYEFHFVLVHSALKIIRDPGIERAGCTRNNVDVVHLTLWIRLYV